MSENNGSIAPATTADFWRFCRERHEMFTRRFYRDWPRARWTTDPVLRKYSFCNVYRELDRGTRFLMVHILPSHPSPQVVLWRVLLYRAFNTIDVYTALDAEGFTDPTRFDRAGALALLRAREAQGLSNERKAYIISPSLTKAEKAIDDGTSKIVTITRRLGEVQPTLAQLYADLAHAPTMQRAHGRLMQLRGVADFTGYQLAVDLTYPGSLFAYPDQNEWAAFTPGKGTHKGLTWLIRGAAEPLIPTTDVLRRLRQLLAEQPTDLPGPPLTMPNIANACCEYDKLCRARQAEIADQTAKGLRLYREDDATPPDNDPVLWSEALIRQYVKPRRAMPWPPAPRRVAMR